MNANESSRFLGEEKINRLMLRFSIPCILSLLVSSLYNIVDQIFIGNSELSTLGNAATGVVFPAFIIAQAFAWCLGDGCAAYLNICQGRGDDENAHRAIGASVTVAFLSGVAMIAIILPVRTPILTLFGASENTKIKDVAKFLANLVAKSFTEPLEIMLDYIMGAIELDGYRAPLLEYYTKDDEYGNQFRNFR